MADPAYLHVNSPARQGFAISPSDTDFTNPVRAVYVGGTGKIVGILQGDTDAITLEAIPAGSLLPLAFKRITASSTATLMVGVY